MNRPGGELAKRPLQFIWLVDCSGSMAGKKIESLNLAIREAIKPMCDMADENPNVQVFVRVIRFSAGAQWMVSQPTEVHSFHWTDLNADGCTDMGKALGLAGEALMIEKMPERGLPPVLVLISDGQPTDNFDAGLKLLMDQPWGRKAVRVAVAIGEDADLNVLQKFIGNPEIKPLVAATVQDLVKGIKVMSTAPLKAASSPPSRPLGAVAGGSNVSVPAPPAPVPAAAATDVF